MDAFETTVVTLDQDGAAQFDRSSGVRTIRVPAGHRRALDIAALNAAAVRHGRRLRPDVVFSGHIVTAPAARALHAITGAPVAQNFYAKEVGGRPRLAAYAANRADVAILMSRYTEQLVRDAGGRLRRSEVIPPGVDLPAVVTPLPAERPTLLTVARLHDRYKGHDVVLRSLRQVRERVPDVQWVVIGEGRLRPELEALAHSEGVERSVRFLGAVSDAERDEWHRRADVFVMVSRLPEGRLAGEGFGIVYLEAGAVGKPVVAGNVAGALDSVRDGETGLLVDPADPRAVAGALIALLTDPARARAMGEAGVAHAQALAWPHIAARVQRALLALLDGVQPSAAPRP